MNKDALEIDAELGQFIAQVDSAEAAVRTAGQNLAVILSGLAQLAAKSAELDAAIEALPNGNNRFVQGLADKKEIFNGKLSATLANGQALADALASVEL